MHQRIRDLKRSAEFQPFPDSAVSAFTPHWSSLRAISTLSSDSNLLTRCSLSEAEIRTRFFGGLGLESASISKPAIDSSGYITEINSLNNTTPTEIEREAVCRWH
jgi:hypothetical protein